MTITLAGIASTAFSDDADADADVLYLHVGDPEGAVDFDESPEGHHVRFDADGSLITLLHLREIIDRERRMRLGA